MTDQDHAKIVREAGESNVCGCTCEGICECDECEAVFKRQIACRVRAYFEKENAPMTPTQADREFAAAMQGSIMAKEFRQAVLDGSQDTWRPVQQAMTFRLAAEAAAFEKAAAYIEGKGGVIPGATVFISLITGSNQPCMSGDGRDHLHSHKRRQFDDTTSTLATAIRKLAGEKHD